MGLKQCEYCNLYIPESEIKEEYHPTYFWVYVCKECEREDNN